MQFHAPFFSLSTSYLTRSFLLKQDYSTFFCKHFLIHHHDDRYNTPNKLAWFIVQGLAKNHSPYREILIFDGLMVSQDYFLALLSVQDPTHWTHLVIMDI